MERDADFAVHDADSVPRDEGFVARDADFAARGADSVARDVSFVARDVGFEAFDFVPSRGAAHAAGARQVAARGVDCWERSAAAADTRAAASSAATQDVTYPSLYT